MRTLIASLLIGICLSANSCKTNLIKPSSSLSSQSIRNSIDTLIEQADPDAQIGILVVSVDSGAVIYQRNSNQTFMPASTLKIVTAAAALHYLGPSFRFETKVFASGFQKDAIDNLYIQASGDPSLSDKDLSEIAVRLKQLGVKRIRGHLIIDNDRFDGTQFGGGWMWDDMQEGYSAPISALSVDHNRLIVYAKPAAHVGEPGHVFLQPSTSFVKVQGSAVTAPPNTPSTLKIGLSQTHLGLAENQSISVSGALPLKGKTEWESFSIQDPMRWFSFLLKEQLKKNQIHFHGDTRLGEVPRAAMGVAEIVSRPLSESLNEFVKVSNNHAMECLIKTLGVNSDGRLGSFKSGIQSVFDFLAREVKVNTEGFVMADGSGLSRYNRMTPTQLSQVLQWMWKNFHIGPEFLTTLPIGGEDGTLKYRLSSPLLKGKVRAKTGSMSNINGLAGYLITDRNEVLSFAIMMNGFTKKTNRSSLLIENILLSLL